MKISVSSRPNIRLAALGLSVLAGYVSVLSTGPIAANMRLNQIDPARAAYWYSLMAAAGALVGALGYLCFGLISNRLLRAYGSRQPIFIGASAAIAVFGFLLSQANQILTIFLLWCLLQLPASALLAVGTAIVLEKLDQRRLGLASALFGVAGIIAIFYGALVGALTANEPTLVLLIGFGTASALVIPAALMREKSEPIQKTHIARARVTKPFALFLVSVFALMCAVAISSDYYLQVALRLTGNNLREAAALAQILSSSAAATFLLFGFIGGFLSRRKHLTISWYWLSILIASAGVVLISQPTQTWLVLFGSVILGAGNGLNIGLQLPVMKLVLGDRTKFGGESGVFNVVGVLASAIVPLLGATMISISPTNWTELLGITIAVFALVGALMARAIRVR